MTNHYFVGKHKELKKAKKPSKEIAGNHVCALKTCIVCMTLKMIPASPYSFVCEPCRSVSRPKSIRLPVTVSSKIIAFNSVQSRMEEATFKQDSSMFDWMVD